VPHCFVGELSFLSKAKGDNPDRNHGIWSATRAVLMHRQSTHCNMLGLATSPSVGRQSGFGCFQQPIAWKLNGSILEEVDR